MSNVQNILQSVTLKEYVTYASQLAANHKWEEAYEYWNYIRLHFSEEKEATYHTAKALYKLQEFEEAQQLLISHLEEFPDHFHSEILLGDIAQAQNNYKLAYQYWESVRSRYPEHVIGYIKLAKLAEERNPAEAVHLWADIGDRFPNIQGVMFKALADIYIKYNYWHLAIETAREYVRRHGDANSYLLALTINLRYIKQHERLQFEGVAYHLFAQCTHALQKFPDNLAIRIFEAKLALHFHEYSMARGKFEILADEYPESIAIHTHYAKALIILGEDNRALEILLSQLGNPSAIESGDYVHVLMPLLHIEGQTVWQDNLDKLLKLMLYPDVLLLLVSHLEIFSLFDDALAVIELALGYSDEQFRLLYLKAKERIQNAKHVSLSKPYGDIFLEPNSEYLSGYKHLQDDKKSAVDTHIQLINKIQDFNQNLYLNTHASAHDAFQVSSAIITAIKSKTPFSLVRSDGHLLPYAGDDSVHYQADQRQYELECWNGNQFIDLTLHEQALLNADIIGIPEKYPEFYLDDSDLAVHRRARAILSWVLQQQPQDTVFTSSHIHHDLQIWGLYDYIFSHIDSVSVVAHAPVEDQLMLQFGIGVRIEHLVPCDYQMQTPLDSRTNAIHYPELFKKIIGQINVGYQGEVYLVSAGALSGIYCDAIKQQGGIALDVGQTLDLWVREPKPDQIVNQELLPFYRIHRTSLWWRYLNSIKNIPYQKLLNNRPKTYWINLAIRIDRRISVANNLNTLNIPHQRIEAITPNNLPAFQMKRDQLSLLEVEKACLASHLVTLDTGIANGDQIFFVQEDDLHELAPVDYNDIVATAPNNWDVLQLHTHGIEALRYNYVAYLSGHMWLPWNWKNPSTASYLTNTKGAKKILDMMEYDTHRFVNLQSVTPSLPVADRALYKDFHTYTTTYPFTITDGSESDILNVNSFRHVNASMLSRRFHVMTHPDNPQLRFNQKIDKPREDTKQNIIIVLGASILGFSELGQLLNRQASSFISNQMGQHPYRFPSWENDKSKVFSIINYILETRDCDHVGDMMSTYLNYVEMLISLYPNAKFVCLHSTVEDEVEALLHIEPHTNIYQDHSRIGYQQNHIYDRSVDKFDPQLTKVEAIQSYVEMYAGESSRLATKYPAQVWRFNIDNLNDPDKVMTLLNWLGYEKADVISMPSFEPAKTNILDMPNYGTFVLRREALNPSQFLEYDTSYNHYIDPNLYEIHIYRGRSQEKESIVFVDDDSASDDVVFQIDFLRTENLIVLNNLVNSSWGDEKRIRYTYRQDTIIFAYYDELFHCMYLLDANRQHFFTFELHHQHRVTGFRIIGHHLRLLSRIKPQNIGNLWRLSDKTSGFDSFPLTLKQSKPRLRKGLSMIIRAKNEEATVEKCLTTILPHVDEVIFVDNGSTDQTRLIAERLQRKYFNLKIFSYPIQIPRIGQEHCQSVLNQSTNTLGHYYNWCLSHSTLMNFSKWDADYICLEDNFVEMITQYQLRTRGDNFALWFSGLEIYTDGERYWVDRNSSHNEYRMFSRKHGAHWVNLPPWEEIEQSYLYRAHKLVYDKPVYVELFRLDEIEFRDRGVFEADQRDRERMNYVQRFKETGNIPNSFLEVSGIDDPKLKTMRLSDFEIQDMRRATEAFHRIPKIVHRSSGELLPDLDKNQLSNVFTIIMSCRQNRDKQDVQRQTWIKDMERTGFTYAFVEGEIGRPDCLVNDRLFLNCRDEYEFLASKTLAIVKWVYNNTNFDYLLKIDDDVILNPQKLAQFDYSKFDYIGGRLIHDVFDPLWHKDKTWNEQLLQMYCQIDEITPYYGGQFSYFLSRHAMKVLIDNSNELTTQLYEDFGVGRALSAGGIKPATTTLWKSRNYKEWQQEPRFDMACISDIPIEHMQKVYETWSKSPQWLQASREFNSNYQVNFDWMDIPHVISQLHS